MVQSDILIIGAGPVGLFTVFEAGLLKLKCHLIDSLPIVGGQCAELYPKKPIFDIPGIPEILAQDLITNLQAQIKPFEPTYTLGERAVHCEKDKGGFFCVTTDKGTKHRALVIIISGGLGSFEPRKPQLENLAKFEENGVYYKILNPKQFKDKKVIVSGGGDSALDWSIYLSKLTKKTILIHRRREFRSSADSVEKVQKLKDSNKIEVITPAEVTKLYGKKHLEEIEINQEGKTSILKVDAFIPLFGLTPKLDLLATWGMDIKNDAFCVDNTLDYQTNIPGIFAVGDVNTYPGKLKLILCGFHEVTLACQSAYKIIHPDKKHIMKYTTVSGISGFDGSKKESPKMVIKKII